MGNKLGIAFVLLILSVSLVAAQGATSTSDVRVTLLNQDPDPVEQGEIVEVRFKVENFGPEVLDDIQVEITPDYPFTLYTGSLIKNVGRLQARQVSTDAAIVDFKLLVDQNAVEGENEIELKLRVGPDITRVFDNDEFLIDVETEDVPDIRVYIRDRDVLKAGEGGKINIELANADIGDAKFTQLTLLPSEDYLLLSSSNYVYLGDIDSDDTESEEFSIYVNDNVKDSILVPVLVEYQDSDEIKYQERFDLELEIFSSAEITKFGLRERSNTRTILVIIVLIIAGYIYWRRRNKKK